MNISTLRLTLNSLKPGQRMHSLNSKQHVDSTCQFGTAQCIETNCNKISRHIQESSVETPEFMLICALCGTSSRGSKWTQHVRSITRFVRARTCIHANENADAKSVGKQDASATTGARVQKETLVTLASMAGIA